MPTQGEVSVRFSVKDQEAVSQALTALGKDGQAALDKLNAAGQAPSRGLNAISTASELLKNSVVGLAYSVGPLGSVLLALGPVGTAVAATFGAIIAAFNSVKDGAKAFQDYARSVHDFAETTGISVTQVQALSDALGRHGVSADQAQAGVQKLATAFTQARQGTGELYAELKLIDPALAKNFMNAKDLNGAILVLVDAMKAVDQPTALFLSRLALGKGGGDFIAGLKEIAGKGGLGAVADAAVAAGTSLTNNVIAKQKQAAAEAAQRAQETERAWNGAYAAIYDKWKDFRNLIGLGGTNFSAQFANNLKGGVDYLTGGGLALSRATAERNSLMTQLEAAQNPGQSTFGQRFLIGAVNTLRGRGTDLNPASVPDLQRRLQDANDRVAQLQNNQRQAGLAGERSELAPEKTSTQDRLNAIGQLKDQVNVERDRLGILGDVATTEEKIKAKAQEVTLALMERKNVTKAEADLVNRTFANQAQAAEIATRTTLGVASGEERRGNFLEHLNILIAEGKVKEEDRAKALDLYNKNLKDTIENERVRAAALPGLERMIIDAGNLNKTMDTFGTTVAGDVGNAFVNITSGTQSAAAGFKALEAQVIQSVIRMTYQMTVAKLVAQGLSSILGAFLPGAGAGSEVLSGGIPLGQGGIGHNALGNVFGAGGLMRFASGGVVNSPTLFAFANGTGLMGEAGPEAIMPLSRGRDGKLGVQSGGGGPVVNVIIENNSTAQASVGQPQKDNAGNVNIVVMMKQALKDSIATGEFDGVMGGRFGAKTGTLRR